MKVSKLDQFTLILQLPYVYTLGLDISFFYDVQDEKKIVIYVLTCIYFGCFGVRQKNL